MLESAIFPFYFHFGFNNLVPERRKSIWMLLGSDSGPARDHSLHYTQTVLVIKVIHTPCF